MRYRFPMLLAALVLAPGVFAQACRSCHGRGEKDCPRHRHDLELEHGALQCSVVAECPKCHGALTIDCPQCDNKAVEQAAEARRQAAAKWLAKCRADVDAFLPSKGKGVLHAKSEHVDLTFSIRPMTIGRKRFDTHHLMHLYLDRIEALRRTFLDVFELSDADFSARLQVYMFEDQADHAALAPRVAGGGAHATGMKYMGNKSIYCMYHDKRQMPGDEGLHRTIVHNVTHLVLSNMKPEVWLGNRKHGWLDEGVAHYFEDKITGLCTNYCYEEVGVPYGAIYKGGKWRVPLRKMLEAGKLEPFTKVASLNTDQLNARERAQSFAYVDFLISRYGGKAFADLVRRVKRGEATRDALQAAFGLPILSVDAEFAAWVRDNYPLQER